MQHKQACLRLFQERTLISELGTVASVSSVTLPSNSLCAASTSFPSKKEVNYDDETLWREFSPSQKDLAFNVALAPTLIWIPFSVAAIGRCAFVKYRITDKRVIVKTEAPWRSALPGL
jgi:hypothetical protein